MSGQGKTKLALKNFGVRLNGLRGKDFGPLPYVFGVSVLSY
jgi:hypothetical protein